jgi:hypothetical protein
MLMANLSDKYLYEFNTNNISGKMSSIKYVSKNFPNDYNFIIEFTKDLDITFKQKVYHTINKINQIVVCKNKSCDNPVKFKNTTIGYYEYCSNKCIGSDPEIIEKKIKKSIERFGTKTPSESEEIKKKIIKTNIKKYGGNSPMSSKKIRDKSKQTLIKNWGVDNPSKSLHLIEKRMISFKKNIDTYKDNYKKTSLEKYGFEHPWMNRNIHIKSVISSTEIKIKNAIEIARNRLPEDYKLVETYSKSFGRILYDIECPNCKKIFTITSNSLYDRTIRTKSEVCTLCNPFDNKSGQEIDLLNYIKKIYSGEILTNDRNIISPYEIDIYLPDIKIAFEFNGLYWHSEMNKSISYHSDKTNKCLDKDIRLIHIWEDDWFYKNNIIKSIIKNAIGNTENKIWARKCFVREVDKEESRKFLNLNHIQGNSMSSIKLGLFHGDELVSLMTFGKCRVILNQKKNKEHYELIRFVNKIGFSVIGGASKLFSYFLKKYSPENIISYSDNAIFDGGLYKRLGFDHISDTGLDYYWVIDKKRKHRYNFRKSNLIKMGYDKNKTEREIMYDDVGSYRIWGCGMKKWIWIQKI